MQYYLFDMFGLIVFFRVLYQMPLEVHTRNLLRNGLFFCISLFLTFHLQCSLCVVLAGSVDTQGQPSLMCCSVRYSWLGDGCKSTDKMTFSLMNDGQGGHYFELLAKLCADTVVWFCMGAGVLFGSWKFLW